MTYVELPHERAERERAAKEIVEACDTFLGAIVFLASLPTLWQVAPVGADTPLGQRYLCVRIPDDAETIEHEDPRFEAMFALVFQLTPEFMSEYVTRERYGARIRAALRGAPHD